MTITLWNKVQAKMLPTPAKFHYLFNMRELSKVFQGITLAARDRCATCTTAGHMHAALQRPTLNGRNCIADECT
jgi:hypothetical protein